MKFDKVHMTHKEKIEVAELRNFAMSFDVLRNVSKMKIRRQFVCKKRTFSLQC